MSSSASAYIKTVTAAVTRAADVLTYPSAGNIDETGDYWLYAEHAPVTSAGSDGFAISTWNYFDGIGNAGFMLRAATGVGDLFTGGSGAITNVSTANTVADGLFRKTAGTVSGAVSKVCMDGGAVASGTNSMPASASSTIYIAGNAAVSAFTTIRNVRIGQRQLSASEMQAITA